MHRAVCSWQGAVCCWGALYRLEGAGGGCMELGGAIWGWGGCCVELGGAVWGSMGLQGLCGSWMLSRCRLCPSTRHLLGAGCPQEPALGRGARGGECVF